VPGTSPSEWEDMVQLSGLREACGVIGIYAPTEDVARLAYFGLFALQHRGQESAGIATTDGTDLHVHTRMGLVSQVFDESDLSCLTGFAAIGHTRYSTTGSSRVENAQPLVVQSDLGPLALGHNGNLTNTSTLGAKLARLGITPTSTTDSEVLGHLCAHADGSDWLARLRATLPQLSGAFCLTLLTKDAARHPTPLPRTTSWPRRRRGWRLGRRLGELRSRHDRRAVHPRNRPWRAAQDRRARGPH
jgi:amidophosphoribosyltransferase